MLKDTMVIVCLTNAGCCTYPNLDLYHSAKSQDHNVPPMNFPAINEHCLVSAMRLLHRGIILENFELLDVLRNPHNSWLG
jgi:hypothetical protein